ncbi:hypothetical protein HNQ60_003317 [Povalibacter uvarum]|uniref:Uncharacterized protein n=1 Tax=Povalibacter uvarum TaxID=732238 RepID=A0A841HNI8_9GAMM|nr:hypothetical protein [Povalibacter uvarum]
MKQLANDPEYQARIAERDRKIAAMVRECADEEALIASEAARLGYRIESVWDFVNNDPHPFLPRPFVGPYERAYPLLVRHLKLPHHHRVREGIVRALTVRDGGDLVSEALLHEFHSEKDPELRWVIANALITAMPYHRRRKVPEIAEVRYGKKRSDKSPHRTRSKQRPSEW